MNYLTANGTIRIDRCVWWYGGGEPSDGRVDQWLGIADSSVSLGSRELCCLMAMDCSFVKASGKLKQVGQIDVSVERLRTIVEGEGVAMLATRSAGLLSPDWSSSECRPNLSEPLSPSNPSCVLVGGDGVMIPVITAAEKARRRAGRRHVRRRGVKRRRVRRHRGADQGWKEFKIGQFYSPDKSRCWVFATQGNHEEFGRQLRRESFKIHMEQADRVASITDGAVWLGRQMQRRLPKLNEKILDFYHVAEHVAATSASCWGLETSESKAWTGHVLHQAKHKGAVAVLEEILIAERTLCGRTSNAGLSKRVARTALAELKGYVGKRVEMMDYPRFIAEGYDIGSGPTEAKCKTVPHRLKGSGMRWNQPNAEAMAALACTEQSNMLPTYWALQRQQLT